MRIKYSAKLIKAFVTAFLVIYQAVFLLLPLLTVNAQTAPTINFLNPPSSVVSGTVRITAQVNGIISDLPVIIHFPGGYGSRNMTNNGNNTFIYDWDTTTLENGYQQNIFLSATYSSGTSYINIESPSITVVVNNTTVQPQAINVSFLSPAANAVINGTAQIQAQVSVLDTQFTFSLYSDSSVLLQENIAKTRSDYTFTAALNTTTLSNGRYLIRAVATKDGYTSGSSQVYFYVNNYNTPTFLDLNFITPPTTVTSSQNIIVETNQTGTVKFNIYKSGTAIGSAHSGTSQGNNRYYYYFDISNLANGSYMITATIEKSGYTTVSKSTNLEINKPAPPVTATTTEIYYINLINAPTFISGPVTIAAQTNFIADSVVFLVSGAQTRNYNAISNASHNYSFYWDLVNFPVGDYQIKVTALKNGTSYTDSININFSKESYEDPAQSTSTVSQEVSYLISFTEKPASPASGDKKISIAVNNQTDSAEFEISKNNVLVKKYSGIKTDSLHYYFIWPTREFSDGVYSIKSGVLVNGAVKASQSFSVEVKNTTTVPVEPILPLTIKLVETPKALIAGVWRATAEVNQKVEKIGMTMEGIKTGTISGTRKDDNHYELIWTTNDYPDGAYKLKIFCSVGDKNALAVYYAQVKNILDVAVEKQIAAPAPKPAVVTENKIMPACKEKGILDTLKCQQFLELPQICQDKNILDQSACQNYLIIPEECRIANKTGEDCLFLMSLPNECRQAKIFEESKCEEYMQSFYLPEECKQAGKTNQEECKKYIFTLNMPVECQEAKAGSREECDKIIKNKYVNLAQNNISGLNQECVDAGISNNEACKTHMLNQYTGLDEKNYQMPEECEKAGIKTAEECKVLINQKFLPEECTKQGIKDLAVCKKYLDEKYLTAECQAAGVTSKNECDKFMLKKYGPKECMAANIENEIECKNYIFNKYSARFSCQGLDSWECKNSVSENYLGSIVAKQSKFNEIKEKLGAKAGTSARVEEIKNNLSEGGEIVPIKEGETGLKILTAEDKIFLDKNSNLIQTSPLAVMIDSDQDGLPDDLEKNLGTDPSNRDTDQDGYSDAEEIKNGYNPAGPGKLDKVLEPVEQAIIGNSIFGQPKTDGETSETYTIEKIDNTANSENEKKYIFNGQAEPDKVLTIYIYSDLPIIATVKADAFGNWQYELDKSLIDGEHEVYVALNDNTGKVLSKSSPLNFFIKEAKAVTVEDFIATAKAESPKKSDSYLNYYLFSSGIIIVVGLLMFVWFFIRHRNREIDNFKI